MKDFIYYAPTEVVFGKRSEEKVAALEKFYHAIGMPVNIPELIGRDITDDEIREMVRKCSKDYTHTTGQFKVLQPEDMEAVYRMAAGR